MKNDIFFQCLVLCTGAAMILVDFLVLLFFGHSFSDIFIKFIIPAVVFLAVYCGIMGRNAQCFRESFWQGLSGNEFSLKLKKMGAVPIRMIVLNVVLHFLFLAGIFFDNRYLGIEPAVRTPLFLAALSFGMLAGTFMYVMGDGLVSRTLIAHNFTSYPRDLREKRQELKLMIVPAAVTLISIMFTCSVTLLGVNAAAGTMEGGKGGAWRTILVPLLLFFLCVAVLASRLKKNSFVLYSSIIEQLENLSSEQKDLTRRITLCSIDELGTITGMVNAFCEHLGAGIRDIKAGQRELSAVGTRLQENASGIANSITKVSGAAEQVLAKIKGQQKNVNNASQAIQQTAAHIKDLEKSITTQASSMDQASAAVEEMVGNIASIGTVTEKMTAQFETVGKAAGDGSRIQQESGNRIQEIVLQSQSLQEANRIIAVIAAKTNLLAMNAAIEAAHAGDAGRGFSVVADEIRSLAENSSAESRKIGAELKQIVTTIDQIVKDADSSMKAFTEVSRRIDETEKLVVEVDRAIREQKTGAGQVLDSLRVMNEITVQVRSGSGEMGQGNEAMLNEMHALQDSAGEIAVRMEEMSGGIKNLNSSARDVSQLATVTHSSIEKISAIADGFAV